MVIKKPRIVIIGAGMAGLTAANRLYTSHKFTEFFELCVVEGGTKIGGRINTSELGGDRIELGATWIHGIDNSPIHKIAQEIHSLESEQPWERMDGFHGGKFAIAEGGYKLDPVLVGSVKTLFRSLLGFIRGKKVNLAEDFAAKCLLNCRTENPTIGTFLRKGLQDFLESVKEDDEEFKGYGDWSKKMLVEGIFSVYENILRGYYAAGDLSNVDYNAEREYQVFPGEEITIAKGYMSIIESLSSVLPAGMIQLGRKVEKIEWLPSSFQGTNGPVKLHFCDGSTMEADHVIATVSLGVLKAGTRDDSGLFYPPLPSVKTAAISKLGYGVVDKLFLQISPTHDQETNETCEFPNLHMVFHRSDSEFKDPEIPWWMRKAASLCPIYNKSSVILSWFAGEEALALESLSNEEIIDKVSTTVSSFFPNSGKLCNENVNPVAKFNGADVKFTKILRSKWGSDPLFMGSYSYVAVGSSGDDIDKLAEPLPENGNGSPPPLQVLFAGEATHRNYYSTTHGAYFSGVREAERLLHYYQSNSDV